MMALASITHFEQYDTNKWLVEIEVGGLVCKRRKVIARTLPEVLFGIEMAYREIATPEMLEAQGMGRHEIKDPGHNNGIGEVQQVPPEQVEKVLKREEANRERMARVRAAKAAKHAKEVTA